MKCCICKQGEATRDALPFWDGWCCDVCYFMFVRDRVAPVSNDNQIDVERIIRRSVIDSGTTLYVPDDKPESWGDENP
jgi:hypothetical protein